jgi:NADP-dependent 3-hydroxy acid dehydrogenase YdfG
MGAAEQRVTWVVGASSGIGEAAALAAARTGRRVVLSARREERLAALAERIRADGGEALVLPGDAAEAGWAETAVAAAREAFGALDEVVLAAGLNVRERHWADQTTAGFDAVVTVNLLAAVHAIAAALPALRERGGTVVVVSSRAAWEFNAGSGVGYSASKSALAAVVRSLNVEEAAHGVRATHLCPGDVATDFLQHRPQVPDEAARARMLTPDDVARSILHVLDAPPHVRIDELVLSPLAQA